MTDEHPAGGRPRHIRETATPTPIPADVLARGQELYENGLCLQALRELEQVAPIRAWSDVPALLLGGRVAFHLGGTRLAYAMHARAWRVAPSDQEAAYFYGSLLLRGWGPYQAWSFVRRRADPGPDVPAPSRAAWLSLKASILAAFRDFDGAESLLSAAEEATPDHPWVHVERAHVQGLCDRWDSALQSAQRALVVRPWYKPAITIGAHACEMLGRDGEALELLQEASRHVETVTVPMMLAALQRDMDQFEDFRRSLDECERLAVLADKDYKPWLEGRMCDAAYYCGDLETARARAANVDSPLYKRFAQRLAEPLDGARRVVLPVGFVRQNHMTCAPATFAAIARFFDKPADHLAVAEAICYDGTPGHKTRNWAENNGWFVREFTCTLDAARTLIDRGVPFALSTVFIDRAHLQAVIGYDTFRNSILIRDPSARSLAEFDADAGLEVFKDSGPQAMVLVPAEKRGLIEDIELPDSQLYDLLYRMSLALDDHRRDEAAAAIRELQDIAPEHQITLDAQGRLANYDGDNDGRLQALKKLLAVYPDSAVLEFRRLVFLRGTEHREERLKLLQEACSDGQIAPHFLREYARELSADARSHTQATRYIRKALRYLPDDAASLQILADVLWSGREFEEAFELYRFAHCLDDKDEEYARTYFRASLHFKRSTEALALLEGRFRRFGEKSGWPARTLFHALAEVERMGEALQILDDAVRLKPDDGDLMLFAAEQYASRGLFERAEMLLDAAKSMCSRVAWLSCRANVAASRLDDNEALLYWKQLCECQPLNPRAHSAIASILERLQGREAAVAHLEEAGTRFPHNWDIQRLRLEWVDENDDEKAVEIAQHLAGLAPEDASAHRLLASKLAAANRLDEAFQEIETARQIEPSSPNYYEVYGSLCVRAAKRDDAKEAFRSAIRLFVDSDAAIRGLLSLCNSPAERREAILFVESELIRQVTFGEGVIAWHALATDTLNPEEVLESLKTAHRERPDLWHTWSALARQFMRMGMLREACEIGEQAVEHFPLLPPCWTDLAAIYRALDATDKEIAALRRALEISPGWSYAVRELAHSHERLGQFDATCQMLERALQYNPNDAYSLGGLADVLWKTGRRKEAVEHVQRALRLDPDYEWAWNALCTWAVESGQPDLAVQTAREMVARRPGAAAAWLVLGSVLDRAGRLEERVSALVRAVELAPRSVDAHDAYATALAEAGRFDEALAACRPKALGDPPPHELRGRAASVEAIRGDFREAVRQISELVREDPNYQWGWYMLFRWCGELDDADGALEAAEQLARLSPQNPFSHFSLAEARLERNDRDGAKRELERAVRIDPEYAAAGMLLFDLEIEDKRFDEAARALDVLQKQVGGPFVQARAISLAAARKDCELATQLFVELCRMPSSNDMWPIGVSIDTLTEAGLEHKVDEALDLAVKSVQPSRESASFWAERAAGGGKLKEIFAAIDRLSADSEGGRAILASTIETLGRERSSSALDRIRRKYESTIIADTTCWAQLGTAYLDQKRYHFAMNWMGDWGQRTGLQPHMLLVLSVAYRYVGRWEEANKANLAAVELPPDSTTDCNHLWLAFDAAVAGDLETAEAHFACVVRGRLNASNQMLERLVQAVFAASSRGRSKSSRAPIIRASQYLGEAKANHPGWKKDRLLVMAFKRAVAAIARTQGGWKALLFRLQMHPW